MRIDKLYVEYSAYGHLVSRRFRSTQISHAVRGHHNVNTNTMRLGRGESLLLVCLTSCLLAGSSVLSYQLLRTMGAALFVSFFFCSPASGRPYTQTWTVYVLVKKGKCMSVHFHKQTKHKHHKSKHLFAKGHSR